MLAAERPEHQCTLAATAPGCYGRGFVDREFQSAYHTHEGAHWWSVSRRDMIVRLLDAARVAPQAHILDVGCASGRLVEELRGRGHRSVTGIDVSAEAIESCRRRGLDDVHVMPADQLAFPDDSHDVVIASDVLEHIEDDMAALQEWRRVLRPGGKLIVFVPAFMFLWSQHDVVNHHHRRYDRRGLMSRLSSAELLVERVAGWNLALLAPAATIRGLRRLARRNDELHHDLQVPKPWVNRLLVALLSAENQALTRRSLGPGISLFAVASKPAAP